MAEVVAQTVLYYLASYGVQVSLVAEAFIVAASYVAVAAGSYYLATSMQKMPSFNGLQNSAGSKMSMTRETTPSHRIIYGTQRVSGPIAFASTNGDKNRDLHLVVLLAGHQTNGGASAAGHLGVYLNDLLAQDREGVVQEPFVGTFDSMVKNGNPGQTAYDINAAEWMIDSGSRTLTGLSAIYGHFINDPNVYPSGIPNVSVVLQGKQCLDLRDSVVKYTENPSLILYDYLKNEFGCSENELESGSFITAANICDETVTGTISANDTTRYTCNYTFLTSERPETIIQNILKTCYGKIIFTDGKIRLLAGAFIQPTVTLNESDLRGGIQVTTKSSIAEAYNVVTGLYVTGNNATSSFQSAEFVPVTSSYYLAEDNGYENVMNIELVGVNDERIARRIAKLSLLDARQDLTITYPTKMSGLQLVAGDTVYINNDRFGWTNKVFEVISLAINPDLTTDLVLKETSADIYTWADSEQDVVGDLSPNTTLPDPFLVESITNFSASNVPTRDTDGTIFPGIELTWTNPGSASISAIELDYKADIDPAYTSLAKLSPTNNTFTTIDVTAGTTYDFRIRNYNYFGVSSAFATASILCVGDNTIPQTPTGSAVAGTGSVAFTWTYPNAMEPDYRHTKIVINGVTQGYIAGTTYTKQLSGGGPVTCSLQDFDTSGNGSATSSLIYASVHNLSITGSIGPSGSQGPSGSAGAAGATGSYYETRYKVSDLVPTTPTGDNPAGWSTTMPSPTGAIWSSTALKTAAGVAGTWTTPARVSGNIDFYQSTAPTTGTNTLVTNDWWFDSANNRWYRWNGSAWVDANTIVSTADFGTGIRPVGFSSSLPTLPTTSWPVGSAFTVTGTGVLYRNKAEVWTAETSASLIVGTLVAGQIAAGAISATHIGTNLLVASSSNIGNAVITDAHIVSLSAGKMTAGTIAVAVLLTAAEIQSPRITGSSFVIDSTIGLRRSVDNGVLTITGAPTAGSSYGSQIDLTGNNYGGSGLGGQLVLQAGQGASSTISFLTNQSPSTDVGVARGEFDTYGLFRVKRSLSNGSVYTQDAGNVRIDGNLGVGMAPTNTNTSQGGIDATGAVSAASFNSTSAAKYKTNIHPITNGIELVSKLKPVNFTMKETGRAEFGFVADEIYKVLPSIVHLRDGEVEGMEYGKIVSVLCAAIQEQQKTIDNQNQRISRLEKMA